MSHLIRSCIACGQADDHPRHVIAQGDASILWHMDCHVIATGCEVCEQQIGGADGAQGDELRTHLLALRGDSNG